MGFVRRSFLQCPQENTNLESLFNKAASLKACNFIQKKLEHRCFPVNIAKYLRTAFFTEHLQWLLYSLRVFHPTLVVSF